MFLLNNNFNLGIKKNPRKILQDMKKIILALCNISKSIFQIKVNINKLFTLLQTKIKYSNRSFPLN